MRGGAWVPGNTGDLSQLVGSGCLEHCVRYSTCTTGVGYVTEGWCHECQVSGAFSYSVLAVPESWDTGSVLCCPYCKPYLSSLIHI